MNATLPRLWPSPAGKPLPPAGSTDVFRAFARGLATGARPWTPQAARFVTAQFDHLAPRWDSTAATGRDEPVRDALARGGPFGLTGRCLELGSGTGLYTPLLSEAFTNVVSLDLSEGMLHQARDRSPLRVRADASALPLADNSVDAVAAVDMLLFPDEIARVLASHGALLWINQLGADGPLHLPAGLVARALPGSWTAVEAEAGWGSWAVLRRVPGR